MKLDKQTIIKYAEKYDQRFLKTKEAEIENEVKSWLRKNRYLDKENFIKLCLWKSPRPKKSYENNSEELIKELTAFSLQTKSEEAGIKALTCLSGVSFPVATTILHFAFPNKYSIMDFRAIWSLGWEQPKQYTFEFWEKYYKEIQKLSKKFNLPVRTIDKALWQYSKDNQK
jgi:hypothetical protein